MENLVTTDSVVLSLTCVDQTLNGAMQSSSTDKHLMSTSIMHFISGIHWLFRDVMRTGDSMRRIHEDVADLIPKLRIQQIAFDNGCKYLFATIAKSRQDVDNMIEDPDHPIWTDNITHRSLDMLMSRFHRLCLAALEHYHQSLRELRVELYALSGQGKRKTLKRYQNMVRRSNWTKPSDSPTFSTIEKFFKLAGKLRDYNDLFCTLIWQAVPRPLSHKSEPSLVDDQVRPHAMGPVRASQSHFACIQRASQTLYEILFPIGKCHEHEVDSLNFGLDFDHARTGARFRAKDFRFNVAVTRRYSGVVYRLTIDAAHSDFCVHQTAEDDHFTPQNYRNARVCGPTARATCSNLYKCDAHTAAHRRGGQKAAMFIRTDLWPPKVPELGSADVKCRLCNSSVTIETEQETRCLCSLLQKENSTGFLFPRVLGDGYHKQGSHSLDDILVRANTEGHAIPLVDRLRIALLLAVGVLQLNSSPWLHQVWSSKDIRFFDMVDYDRYALGEPFLHSQLDNSATRGHDSDVKGPAATRSCLLSLGLVLIELAFSAPWRKLQLQYDITQGLLDWERNLLNLLRLNDTVSRELGSRYAKVVRTCLSQDTHHLGKAELDDIIFEDVVSELDRCLSVVTFDSGV